MNSGIYGWFFWVIIGAGGILAFIALQLLFNRLAEKEKKKVDKNSDNDSGEDI